ncbi:hypothetical protein DVH24_025654 [Malus domestica]|uniref:Uncharacterized protein n=1 Tax=Malus domestica TaxID=3750 RepID=A0A498KFU9_MALDO|nr:hypothetical protein DVH24_025654 [Malus domestica]
MSCHIPVRAPTTSRHDIVRFGSRPRPHYFVSGNSHENFLVSHPSWDCSRTNSLNFGVPTEPEAIELPKSLVLSKYENIHIRLPLTLSAVDHDARVLMIVERQESTIVFSLTAHNDEIAQASLISVNSDHDQYRVFPEGSQRVGLPERGLGVESDSREGYRSRVGARFTFDFGNHCTDREMWRNVGVGLRGTRVQRNGVGGMCWWVRNSGPRVLASLRFKCKRFFQFLGHCLCASTGVDVVLEILDSSFHTDLSHKPFCCSQT